MQDFIIINPSNQKSVAVQAIDITSALEMYTKLIVLDDDTVYINTSIQNQELIKNTKPKTK